MPDFMQEYIGKCKITGEKVIPFATAGAKGKDKWTKDLEKKLK